MTGKQSQADALKREMADAEFWENQEKAQAKVVLLKSVEFLLHFFVELISGLFHFLFEFFFGRLKIGVTKSDMA